MEGKTIKGGQFLLQVALPNFYFHVTTAYAILRHNGVDLGKTRLHRLDCRSSRSDARPRTPAD